MGYNKRKSNLHVKDVDSFIFCIKYTICVLYLCVILDSVPEFQEIKRFTPEEKIEDCQSYNNSQEGSNEKDKVNNNLQTPEQEAVLQENNSGLSYGSKLDSESTTSSLIANEEQLQGDPNYLFASKWQHNFRLPRKLTKCYRNISNCNRYS